MGEYYEHFVDWLPGAWPDATLPEDYNWIVSNYVCHFPGRLAPLILEMIVEREYGTDGTRETLPASEERSGHGEEETEGTRSGVASD